MNPVCRYAAAKASVADLARKLAAELVGTSPFALETFHLRQHMVPLSMATSVTRRWTSACWDVMGKAGSQSVTDPLGGPVREIPWGFTQSKSPNDAQYRKLGAKYAASNEYLVGTNAETVGYDTSGTTDDFTYGAVSAVRLVSGYAGSNRRSHSRV